MSCAFLLLSNDPVCFTLKIPMTPCTRTTAKYSRSPRSTWHGRKAAENIAQQINGWEWFHRDVPFFIRNPPPPPPPPPSPYNKGWRVFEVGFGIFSSKKGTTFWPFGHKCFKDADKERTVRFSLFKFLLKFLLKFLSTRIWGFIFQSSLASGAGSTVGVLTLNGTFPTHSLINLQPKHLYYILKLRKKYSLSYAGQMFSPALRRLHNRQVFFCCFYFRWPEDHHIDFPPSSKYHLHSLKIQEKGKSVTLCILKS